MNVLRTAEPGDLPALLRIWMGAFDDSGEAVKVFFEHWFDPELTVVAEYGGEPAAAGYLLPMGTLRHGRVSIPCAMIYAVAVLPEHRGRGLGSKVTRELVRLGGKAGFEAVAVCPAGEGLFDYYNRRAGFSDWFYIRERHLTTEDMPLDTHTAALRRVTEGEYAVIRESCLTEVSHIELNMRAIAYQSVLCDMLGGGLYASEMPDGTQLCAAAERQKDGGIWIKEFLYHSGGENAAFSALKAAFPSETCLVRTPVRRPERDTGIRRFGMLLTSAGCPVLPDASGWLGMAFD